MYFLGIVYEVLNIHFKWRYWIFKLCFFSYRKHNSYFIIFLLNKVGITAKLTNIINNKTSDRYLKRDIFESYFLTKYHQYNIILLKLHCECLCSEIIVLLHLFQTVCFVWSRNWKKFKTRRVCFPLLSLSV